MTWNGANHESVAILITPGYLPERERIESAVATYFRQFPNEQRNFSDSEEETAWLLSSLARRHIGSYYHVKSNIQDIKLGTWVIDQSVEGKGIFNEWFQLPSATNQHYRLFLHAYPREQLGRKLLFNTFDYPHKQLGTRRWRHREAARLRSNTLPHLAELAKAYVNDGHEAISTILKDQHPYHYSDGWPER